VVNTQEFTIKKILHMVNSHIETTGARTMAKKILEQEKDEILEVLKDYPEGTSIAVILQKLSQPINQRNLFHRLNLLVSEGKLIAEGKNRGRRYRPNISEPPSIEVIHHESLIPLTPSGEKIRKSILRPVQERKPVGYERDFLESYRPNETRYLTEEQSKKLHALGRTDGDRPAGTYARQVYNRLLIDLSWNSSRLEGNTYTLLETERLINLSASAEGKDIQETQMILNHKQAIEFLVESADEISINKYTILNLHALLSNNLLADPEAGGRVRNIQVGIKDSTYHPLGIPNVIEECFQQVLDTANAIKDPYEQAFFLMVHLPYLQPFEDINKRVSRLAANISLIKQNLSPLSFIDVPQDLYISGLLGVYELNRIELLRDVFIWAYERSSAIYSATKKTLGEPDPFRLQYRSLIYDTIYNVVVNCLNKLEAVNLIKKMSEQLPPKDQAKFIEISENELRGMHGGNIARYRLRPLQYEAWKKNWN